MNEKGKQINFISWMEELEIEILNESFKDFKKILLNFKKDNIDIKELNSDEIKKLLQKLDNESLNDNDKLKDENGEKIEYLTRYLEIKEYFKNKNSGIFKIKKYKILYFLYGSYINYLNFFDLYENEKYKKFFIDEEKIKWLAFENGPVTDHYKWGYDSEDKKIYLNFENFSDSVKSFLKEVYKIIRVFSVEKLISESHKTNPWKDEYDGSYRKEIEKEKIIKYFKENKPFFLFY